MDKRRGKLITLYELGYIDIDIDGEYKRRVEDVILTKEFTKEQKDSLLEHYDWYYDYMGNNYTTYKNLTCRCHSLYPHMKHMKQKKEKSNDD